MSGSVSSFVIFAEMRTGSNYLESNLNTVPGVVCHGEAFNPHFIGYPKRSELLQVTQTDRDATPERLLARIRGGEGLNGFRYFHDHDARIYKAVLEDRTCAKILLRRHPVQSYVSWKIAQATGQWKLTDHRRRKSARIRFDGTEYHHRTNIIAEFQARLLRDIREAGQSVFQIDYSELNDLDLMNGLLAWLGIDQRLESLANSLKVQNPEPLSDKVENYEDLVQAVGTELPEAAHWETDRGASARDYLTAARAPLAFMPIPSGPEGPVRHWLAALDGVSDAELGTGLSQKDLRRWRRKMGPSRAFTVLRHPLLRAHHAFLTGVLAGVGGTGMPGVRAALARHSGVTLPSVDEMSPDEYRSAFLAFLGWLRANLAGQTPQGVSPIWASQSQIISGFGKFWPPDLIAREDRLPEALDFLCHEVGAVPTPAVLPEAPLPISLESIYDAELEAAARAAYTRDYVFFGFSDYR
ncbi:hypothetical protein SAMN05421688_3023 [Poseidonocella pacifica]|uniref:LPS sulfotransferase NodH n=1 Tax=Poseidonocella pacifica TaxID=871651 RepID=A0A1I0YHA4_9RHOB|nr:hypothetical protein [Poseidonocella pacifica]SFB11880.1 hypothetical protein SAMN05421688_3023 [Poseidonocella pacifica]